jgi:hypothetical protein
MVLLKESLVALSPPVFPSPWSGGKDAPSASDTNKSALEVVEVLSQLVPTNLEIKTVREFVDADASQAVLAEGESMAKAFIEFPFGANGGGAETEAWRPLLSVQVMVATLKFKMRAPDLIASARSHFEAIHSATTALHQSTAFKKVLAAVLSMGNYMNHSTFRGSAHGFDLDSLLTLRHVTSHNSQVHRTLLMFLVAHFKEHDPDVLHLREEFAPLCALDSDTLLALKHNVEEIEEGFRHLSEVDRLFDKPGVDSVPNVKMFLRNVRTFSTSIEGDIADIHEKWTGAIEANRNVECQFIKRGQGEGGSQFYLDHCVDVVRQFLGHLDVAMQENEDKTRLETLSLQRAQRQLTGGQNTAGTDAASILLKRLRESRSQIEASDSEGSDYDDF